MRLGEKSIKNTDAFPSSVKTGGLGEEDSLNNDTRSFPISVWVSGGREQPKEYPEFPNISMGVWGERTA